MEISIKESDSKCKGKGLSCIRALEFIVLSKQGLEFGRNKCKGTLMYSGRTGIQVLIGFPIRPGDVLMWDDIHKPASVHVGIVKYSQKEGDLYTSRLELL